jgi:polar amino acid transport system permease protein
LFDFFGVTISTKNALFLLSGVGMTLLVSAAGILLGMVLAIAVCLCRLSKRRGTRAFGAFYVSFFRGVPLLVQLMLVYYLLPFIGIDLPPLVAAILSLAICTAAYQAENLRGGFLIIPQGHAEAARAFGLSPWQARRHILIPQALRASMPALINEMILILKASSLVSVVGVTDIMRVSQGLVAATIRPIQWYTLAALIYLIINLGLAAAGAYAERRLGRGVAKAIA